MKKGLMILGIVAMAFVTYSCASEGYNMQKGALIGAGVGALAGQIIGGNTASTLIGAAVGGLAGAVTGNAVDQSVANERMVQGPRAVAPVPTDDEPEAPPGQWVVVPGQWYQGKWVATHRVWVPVNP